MKKYCEDLGFSTVETNMMLQKLGLAENQANSSGSKQAESPNKNWWEQAGDHIGQFLNWGGKQLGQFWNWSKGAFNFLGTWLVNTLRTLNEIAKVLLDAISSSLTLINTTLAIHSAVGLGIYMGGGSLSFAAVGGGVLTAAAYTGAVLVAGKVLLAALVITVVGTLVWELAQLVYQSINSGGSDTSTGGNSTNNDSSSSGNSTGGGYTSEEYWNKGSFNSQNSSLEYHFNKHGASVHATSQQQYLNKAVEFSKNLKNATKYKVDGYIDGVMRYIKNGKYIDIAPDGTIVSFGVR